MSRYTHCTDCGAQLTSKEVYYEESGSLVAPPIKLCKHCAINAHVDMSFQMLDDNDFEYNPFTPFEEGESDYEYE